MKVPALYYDGYTGSSHYVDVYVKSHGLEFYCREQRLDKYWSFASSTLENIDRHHMNVSVSIEPQSELRFEGRDILLAVTKKYNKYHKKSFFGGFFGFVKFILLVIITGFVIYQLVPKAYNTYGDKLPKSVNDYVEKFKKTDFDKFNFKKLYDSYFK